jgi:hypothetical protein
MNEFDTGGVRASDQPKAIARRAGILAIALGACESCTRLPAVTDGAIPSDAATIISDAASDTAIASDAATPEEDSGTYHSAAGTYTCCGPGKGLTCCTADAGLFGYEYEDGANVAVGDVELAFGTKPANCFRYGGILGDCAGDGVQFDGKDACTFCCPGLTRVIKAVPNDGGPGPACVPIVPISLFTCMPCGNGICEPEENHCTCPADCP